MGEMGLFGLPFPKEYGGQGGDYVDLCLAVEQLGPRRPVDRGDSRGRGRASARCRCSAAGPRRRRRSGCRCSRRARALAGVRPDGGRRRLRRRRDADDGRARRREWVINGTKQFITNSGTPITRLVTITAVTGERPRRRLGEEGALGDPRAQRDARLHRPAGLRQGRLAHVRHPPAALRGRARARRRTCWASAAAASPTSSRPSTRAASRSPRSCTVPRRAASTRPCATRRAATCSASRSARTSTSRSRSPGWRPACTRRAWPGTTPPTGCVAGQPFKLEASLAKLDSQRGRHGQRPRRDADLRRHTAS